jgi:ATP-dependent Lon protease
MSSLLATIQDIPVVPLRDMVVYPHGVHPLFVGTEKSIRALDAAMATDKQVVLVAKRDSDIDEPSRKDLYEIGTVCTILQLLKLPDGTVKVLVEGGARARVVACDEAGAYMTADVEMLADTRTHRNRKAMLRSILGQFEHYVSVSKKVPQEVLASLSSLDDPGRLIDTIAVQMTLRLEDRQQLLETVDTSQRMEQLLALLESAIDVFQMEKRIRGRVKKQMEKSQREYYLNEQIKAIQ